MTIINIKDFQIKQVENEYFEFYHYMEEFFEEKTTEIDVIKRLCFAVRYVGDLANVARKHIKDGKATKSFKEIIKVEDRWLKKIAEVLDV